MASFFLLWSSFFRTTSTVSSSEAPADYQPAPGRTDGVSERHQRQWIINPSLQICAWNRSWIKGLGKNPQKSELIHWRQCLLSRGTEACSLVLRETPACIHVIQRLSQPRVSLDDNMILSPTNDNEINIDNIDFGFENIEISWQRRYSKKWTIL